MNSFLVQNHRCCGCSCALTFLPHLGPGPGTPCQRGSQGPGCWSPGGKLSLGCCAHLTCAPAWHLNLCPFSTGSLQQLCWADFALGVWTPPGLWEGLGLGLEVGTASRAQSCSHTERS